MLHTQFLTADFSEFFVKLLLYVYESRRAS
jgi:hypothetical protein